MDSRQVIARFEAERQALAMMDHVNIARVFDAGTTESGRPYFVMELVHGVPITKYCDDNHLTPRERLELFVPVCQAIQHAHQKGIIHRDIKPSNVMVTLYDGKPVPKVIDFGVAKATEQKLTERTLFTQYGTMVGTLEYMSPEQAEMSALGVDTRSDIYSLGVLLVRAADGQHAADPQAAEGGGVCRDSPHDQGGGAAQAEHAAERFGRGAGVDLGPAAHGAGQADEAGARRAGLDRDEDPGEGPQPPLRDGQRLRRRRAALPGRRAGAGVPAVGGLSAAEVRAAEQPQVHALAAQADQEYAAAFRQAGIDVDALPVSEAVHRITARRAIAAAVLPALDDWVAVRSMDKDEAATRRLIDVLHGPQIPTRGGSGCGMPWPARIGRLWTIW